MVLLAQEGHIIGASLADNLRLVPGHHGDADLWAAVEWAGLRSWVERLPAGLATPLADRGTNLSAGERQLVALARAALADPSVLILDEASADVDPATEALVTRALDRVTAGRTVLGLAHRLATAERCDRTVTLAAGRVAGDHPNPKSNPSADRPHRRSKGRADSGCFPRTLLRPAILVLLREQEGHGYAIIERLFDLGLTGTDSGTRAHRRGPVGATSRHVLRLA